MLWCRLQFPQVSGFVNIVARSFIPIYIQLFMHWPVGRKEMESNPGAQKSIDVEWNNLESKGAWGYNTVRKWPQVAKEAKSRGEKVHVGNLC